MIVCIIAYSLIHLYLTDSTTVGDFVTTDAYSTIVTTPDVVTTDAQTASSVNMPGMYQLMHHTLQHIVTLLLIKSENI